MGRSPLSWHLPLGLFVWNKGPPSLHFVVLLVLWACMLLVYKASGPQPYARGSVINSFPDFNEIVNIAIFEVKYYSSPKKRVKYY